MDNELTELCPQYVERKDLFNLSIYNKVCKITTDEFKDSGMLFLANQFLQAFGMMIAIDEITKTMYPVKTTYRGFNERTQKEGYEKIHKYLLKYNKELKVNEDKKRK